MTQKPLMDQSLLIIEAARLHSDTPHSLGLLCTNDQPDAGLRPDKTLHCQAIHIHDPGGIQIRNPSKRAATKTRLRQRGHWDRPHNVFTWYTFLVSLRINSDYFLYRINQLDFVKENVFTFL
jgi:hypothetical protein